MGLLGFLLCHHLRFSETFSCPKMSKVAHHPLRRDMASEYYHPIYNYTGEASVFLAADRSLPLLGFFSPNQFTQDCLRMSAYSARAPVVTEAPTESVSKSTETEREQQPVHQTMTETSGRSAIQGSEDSEIVGTSPQKKRKRRSWIPCLSPKNNLRKV